MTTLSHQPDDPGLTKSCPRCGYREPQSEEEAARRLLKVNAGRVHKTVIASALNVSITRLEALAARLGFDLSLRENEPRGA